jgi:CheY-like chemotaxis protein
VAGLESLQVVLADDNENMLNIVTAMLKGAGVRRIKACASGYEAILAISRFAPDVVVVDYNMTPVDGLEFTRFMRVSPLSPDPFVPIILMTGHADRALVTAARDAGVHEVIVKPVTAKGLIARFQSILSEPRDFVRAGRYFGPDRRRRIEADYDGPLHRASDHAPDTNAA